MLPSSDTETYICSSTQIHRESKLTTDEMLEMVLPLWSDPMLYEEDNTHARLPKSHETVKYGHDSHGPPNHE
jgi:hypothetical protein